MKEFVSPRQVARAIQVSESSVKRWCDKGVIPTIKTAGGHRRISLSHLLKFLREHQQPLARPEVIGLPATVGQTERVIDRAADQLFEGLVQGDDERCRQIVLDLFLAEHSLAAICDQVIAPAFVRIGSRWECGEAEVYQERRGCEISLRLLHELRTLIPSPPAEAPVAIGGTVEGDPYNLGTTMAELILRDAQWNAVSLGSNLPFPTLAEAIKQHRPTLFWLSCTHLSDESEFLAGYGDLYDQFGMSVAFVVGGRALRESLRQQMKYAAYCDTMQHLEAVAQNLRPAGSSED
jgi:excisionase family DNA binding protein